MSSIQQSFIEAGAQIAAEKRAQHEAQAGAAAARQQQRANASDAFANHLKGLLDAVAEQETIAAAAEAEHEQFAAQFQSFIRSQH